MVLTFARQENEPERNICVTETTYHSENGNVAH